MKQRYLWISQETGECVFTRWQMVRVIIENVWYYKFLDLSWKKEKFPKN